MSDVLSPASVAAPAAAEHWLVQRTRELPRNVPFTHMRERVLLMFSGGVFGVVKLKDEPGMQELRELVAAKQAAEALIEQWVEEALSAGQEEAK